LIDEVILMNGLWNLLLLDLIWVWFIVLFLSDSGIKVVESEMEDIDVGYELYSFFL